MSRLHKASPVHLACHPGTASCITTMLPKIFEKKSRTVHVKWQKRGGEKGVGGEKERGLGEKNKGRSSRGITFSLQK